MSKKVRLSTAAAATWRCVKCQKHEYSNYKLWKRIPVVAEKPRDASYHLEIFFFEVDSTWRLTSGRVSQNSDTRPLRHYMRPSKSASRRHTTLPMCLNPLEFGGNNSATSNNMKLVHWPLIGGLLHLVQRGGDCAGPQPAQPPPRWPNVTAHLSTASVSITVLLYFGLLQARSH